MCGCIAGRPVFSHSSRGENYYVFPLETERLSGTIDTSNILARESLLNSTEIISGKHIRITGELRSYNNKSGEGSKLIVSVFARSLEITDDSDRNIVKLTGALCKSPNFRKTPLGRDICDLMLAVTRRYGRSDYIPCIVWGKAAEEASRWSVGNVLQLIGRLQSRQYIKTIDDISQIKTAFEVSVSSISLL